MNKKEFEELFAAAAEKSGVTELARKNQFAENLEAMMCELRDKLDSFPAERPSEDLDGEIKLYQLRNPVINHSEKSLSQLVKRVAIHFANWQKEQLMKSAIDGCYIKRNRYNKENVLNGLSVTCDAIQKFRDGDKVKVIIVKEGRE